MIFSRPKKAIKNLSLSEDVQTLASWLGIDVDDLEVSGTNSLKEITVYTCIKILSETIGKLPLKIYQDNNGIKKATDHYLYSMLKLRPNAYMSSSDFWKCVETQRNIHGNSYVWIERVKVGRNAGNVVGLYPIDSSLVQVFVDDSGLLSSKNKVWYVITDRLGKQYKVDSVDVLHFKGVTTNGLVGISPVEYLKINTENAKSASVFLNNSYANGMQTKGVIQYVGDLNPAAENLFRTKFEQMSNGLTNANKVSLLPIGYQYQPISLSMVDSQFLENTNLTIRQLAAAYGIKLHQINDLVKTSYASTAEANKEFYTDTLLAILTMYEQELSYKLLTDREIINGFYSKFNADIILRADIKTRFESYQIGVTSGFLTPNEVRALEEMEAVDGGDQLLINGSVVPITEAGAAYQKGGESNGDTGIQKQK